VPLGALPRNTILGVERIKSGRQFCIATTVVLVGLAVAGLVPSDFVRGRIGIRPRIASPLSGWRKIQSRSFVEEQGQPPQERIVEDGDVIQWCPAHLILALDTPVVIPSVLNIKKIRVNKNRSEEAKKKEPTFIIHCKLPNHTQIPS